jgi:hypothetical protein
VLMSTCRLPFTPNPLLNYRREPSSTELRANIRLV